MKECSSMSTISISYVMSPPSSSCNCHLNENLFHHIIIFIFFLLSFSSYISNFQWLGKVEVFPCRWLFLLFPSSYSSHFCVLPSFISYHYHQQMNIFCRLKKWNVKWISGWDRPYKDRADAEMGLFVCMIRYESPFVFIFNLKCCLSLFYWIKNSISGGNRTHILANKIKMPNHSTMETVVSY